MGQSIPVPRSFWKQRNVPALPTLKLHEMWAIHHYRFIAMWIGARELASSCDNVADVGVTPTAGFSIKMWLARICSSPEQKPTQTKFASSLSETVQLKNWFASQTSSFQNRPSFRLKKGGDYSTLGILSNKSILWYIVEYQKGCEHCSQANTSLDGFHAVQTNACTLPGLCWLK